MTPSFLREGSPMAKLLPLQSFSLQETDDGYRLLVSAIGGESLYVSITADQMDDIIDSLENAMGGEGEGEEGEDDVEY
ncbi:hypothetical protein ASC70_06825 [Caulobacter sp. Root343]|nr:hypothetical protein ASC62_22360 [Caulobacter sp. Root342]KQV68563.1 hypothetical protein ASC70_06825 [Caulobacter sp. Root343]